MTWESFKKRNPFFFFPLPPATLAFGSLPLGQVAETKVERREICTKKSHVSTTKDVDEGREGGEGGRRGGKSGGATWESQFWIFDLGSLVSFLFFTFFFFA